MRIFTADRPLTPSWDLVKPSVALVKKYIWHVLYLSFLPSLLVVAGLALYSGGQEFLFEPVTTIEPRHAAGIVLVLLAMLWSLVVLPAFMYLQLQAIDGKEPGVWECVRKAIRHLPALIGMYIVATVLIIMGFIAFIIPGLLLIRGFMLAPYYIVDQNMGPAQALRQSYRDSRSVSLYIWGIIGVTMVFALLGSILGIIPVFGSVISLAVGYIYVFAEPMRYVEVVRGKLARLPS